MGHTTRRTVKFSIANMFLPGITLVIPFATLVANGMRDEFKGRKPKDDKPFVAHGNWSDVIVGVSLIFGVLVVLLIAL